VYDGFSFVGQIKFEIDSDVAVISISIHQNFRGKGIASRLILDGCKKIFNARTGIKQILAYIKPKNSSSIKSFCGAGFIYLKEEEVNNKRYLLYELTNKGDEV
jgi:RimJ/RimL family protein N-acetyltransferase